MDFDSDSLSGDSLSSDSDSDSEDASLSPEQVLKKKLSGDLVGSLANRRKDIGEDLAGSGELDTDSDDQTKDQRIEGDIREVDKQHQDIIDIFAEHEDNLAKQKRRAGDYRPYEAPSIRKKIESRLEKMGKSIASLWKDLEDDDVAREFATLGKQKIAAEQALATAEQKLATLQAASAAAASEGGLLPVAPTGIVPPKPPLPIAGQGTSPVLPMAAPPAGAKQLAPPPLAAATQPGAGGPPPFDQKRLEAESNAAIEAAAAEAAAKAERELQGQQKQQQKQKENYKQLKQKCKALKKDFRRPRQT